MSTTARGTRSPSGKRLEGDDRADDRAPEREQFDALTRFIASKGSRKQFDSLSRFVAATGSRRLAVAGLFGVALHGLGLQQADARCGGKKGKHKRQCRRRGRDKHKGHGGLFPCQDKLFGLCTLPPLGPGCCNGLACIGTIDPLVTACQFRCQTDDDCKAKFPHKALACRIDLAVCPFEATVGQKCCVPA